MSKVAWLFMQPVFGGFKVMDIYVGLMVIWVLSWILFGLIENLLDK